MRRPTTNEVLAFGCGLVVSILTAVSESLLLSILSGFVLGGITIGVYVHGHLYDQLQRHKEIGDQLQKQLMRYWYPERYDENGRKVAR